MEKSTLIGMVGGVLSVGVGMYLKGADPHALINPAAFLIIIAGTTSAVCNAMPMAQLKAFPKLIKKIFGGQKLMDKQELLDLFVDLAKLAKRDGNMAIEKKANEIDDPFLRSTLTMVADGFNADFIAEVVETDIKNMEARHRSGALIFAQGGMYAPTLGVLGAVIGLIAALGNLTDIEKLGHSIAAAFIATMLGIFTGYVICHPFANKLKQLSEEEVSLKKMMLEGALALQSGASSMAIEAKLQAFIPQTQRKAKAKSMARKKQPEASHEDHPDETWLIPYSDLLTLLLALFIVLFSSSNLDKNKMAQMEYSLAAAFNAIPTDQMNGTVLNFMEDAAKLDLGDDVGIGADNKGAVLDINSLILFDGNSIKIKEEAKPTLDKIAELLSNTKYKRFQVVVEGHTDDVPFHSKEFPSNWELSSARAGTIVRYFISKELVPSRFQAVGMAGISPKYPNLNHFGEPIPENRIRNRRVVIHVEI